MIDKLQDAFRKALEQISEQYGLDAVQVVWSRQEGTNTYSGYVGIGNAYAREGLCRLVESRLRQDNEAAFVDADEED